MLYLVYSSNPFIRASGQKAQFQVDSTKKKKKTVLGFGPNCTATLTCTCGSEEYFVESLATPVEGCSSPGGSWREAMLSATENYSGSWHAAAPS